eukprot:SAG25_NODE_5064_length_707_cov_1.898026_1_plen_108_part_00
MPRGDRDQLELSSARTLRAARLGVRLIILARIIAERKAAEAVKNSTVKLEGKDVMATYKVLTWIIMGPVITVVYSVLAGYCFNANIGLMTALVLPALTQQAIRAQDQ